MAYFIKNIQNFSHIHNLFQKGSKIIIGVSGGPDSVCLVNVMAKIRRSYDLQLHIAHVNYGLRGSDSEKDEILVRDIARDLDIPISILSTKGSLIHGNMENILRNVRYEFFEEQRLALGYDLVAVAHTMDDQAETVLMRLLRGAGLAGMAAMQPKSGKIIRPLLEVSKNDIVEFLSNKNIAYRIDKSNEDIEITRNSIRRELIPLLEKRYNPSIKKTLCANARIVADDYAELEEFFLKKSKKFIQKDNKGLLVSSFALSNQSRSFLRYLVRYSIQTIGGGLHDISEGNITEVLKVIQSTKNKKQKIIFRGLKIEKNGDTVRIGLI